MQSCYVVHSSSSPHLPPTPPPLEFDSTFKNQEVLKIRIPDCSRKNRFLNTEPIFLHKNYCCWITTVFFRRNIHRPLYYLLYFQFQGWRPASVYHDTVTILFGFREKWELLLLCLFSHLCFFPDLCRHLSVGPWNWVPPNLILGFPYNIFNRCIVTANSPSLRQPAPS